MAKFSTKEAAKILGIGEHAVRVGLQRNLFPFGRAIETSPGRYTYWISEERLKKFIKGELW